MAQHSYEIAGITVGIRSTSAAFSEALDELLAAHRSPEDASPLFSVVVSDGVRSNGAGNKKFHILYGGYSARVRTLDLATVTRALLRELEALTFPGRQDAIFAAAALIEKDGVVALVPSTMASSLYTAARGAERAGISLPAELSVAIDAGSGRLVRADPTFDIPDEAIESIAPATTNVRPASSDELRTVDVVLSPVWEEGWEDPFRPLSRGQALTRLASVTLNLEKLGVTALEGIGQLVSGAGCYEIRTDKPIRMLDAVAAILRAR